MTQLAVTSTLATDPAFTAFLAARPQLQRTLAHRPGWCECPRWSVDNGLPIHRHAADCSHLGLGADGRLTRAERVKAADGRHEIHLRGIDLDALSAWIPAAPAPPVVDPAVAESIIRWMVDGLGFHLLKLKGGDKKPAAVSAWNDPAKHPAITADAAVAHWLGGGNLGVLLGPSRLVMIDAEDGAATAALVAAGLRPTVLTAKGACPVELDPARKKVGSSHFWFAVPDGINAKALISSGMRTLPGGGKVEILATPTAMAVVPPTVLTAAAGWSYTAADHPVWTGEGLDPAPAWLFDGSALCPEPVAALAGALVPVAPTVRGPLTERQLEHRDAVDDIAWSAVIGMAGGRLEDWGDRDSTCGCQALHWHTSGQKRSTILHDCGRGKYAFVPSETMRGELRMTRGDKASPLTLAVLLQGGNPREGLDQNRAAAVLGTSLPSRLGGVDVPGAVVTALPTAAVTEPRVGNTVAGVTPGAHAIPGLTGPVLHAVPDVPAATPVDTAGGADDTDDDADDADGVVTPEQRARVRALRSEIAARERKLATMTPGLGRADHWAKCTGVYLHGLVTALIVRSLVDVPPNVLLPSRQGLTVSKAMGMSVNVFGVVAGPSAAGKTDTMNIAAAAIPIEGVGIMEAEDGTSEGICRTARNVEKGTVEITATGLLVAADEIDSVAEEMSRPGSKLDSFSRKVWVGVAAGSNASDRRKKAPLPRHSTRVCLLYGAQPGAVAPLLSQAGRGTPQRFDWGLAGVVRRADRDPLYGTAPTVSIRVNQDRLPWAAGALPPTYTPPAADVTAAEAVRGQPQGAPRAKDPAPPINNVSGADGGEPAGLPGYDNAAPIWVKVPPIVQELIDAEGDRAAERAADWQHAREEDALGVSGHAILLQEKLAFALATWDGVAEVTMQYWDAAGVLIEMRQLVLDALMVEAEIARAAGNTQLGHDRGVVTAEAKAAEAAITERRVASACARLLALVDAAAAQRGAVYRKATKSNRRVFDSGGVHLGYVARSMSRPQGGHLAAAAQRLRESGQVVGDPIIRRPAVMTVPPAVG